MFGTAVNHWTIIQSVSTQGTLWLDVDVNFSWQVSLYPCSPPTPLSIFKGSSYACLIKEESASVWSTSTLQLRLFRLMLLGLQYSFRPLTVWHVRIREDRKKLDKKIYKVAFLHNLWTKILGHVSFRSSDDCNKHLRTNQRFIVD